MDFFAGLFGFGMLLVSLFVLYQYGVKPDRALRATRNRRGFNTPHEQNHFKRLKQERTGNKAA